MSYKIFITGVVQGVGFRPTVYRIAKEMALKGYVRNNGSNVEICIDRKHKEFLVALKNQLPKIARIESIRIEKCTQKYIREQSERIYEGFAKEIPKYDEFKILDSKDGARISLIPADTAVCRDCIAEIFSKKNRRYLYPFTNCVVCGARFSVIKTVPYDRKNTSMGKFALCNECYKEYTTSENRRFHAQTISCPKCGPVYSLYDRNKKVLSAGVEAIEECAHLIDSGKICVLKGWGGMHLCCSLETIEKFRKWYSREEKPFAIMLRNIETVKQYARVNDYETELLTSPQKPIVLLKKINIENKKISPGLPNIGIMLPYSGLHHILFKYMKSDGIVMTSANIPGEPMIIKNDAAFTLGAEYSRAKRVSIRGFAEGNSEVYYLLHNREIVNRCDDSVLRAYKNKTFFIRRSRGYVPEKIDINHNKDILSVGAEENVSTGIAKNGMLYLSQYIGNAAHYETLEFARSSINTLISFLDIKQVDGVAVDLHPRYTTRALGMSIAEEHNSDIVEVQHHWAHAASLMIDNNIQEDEIICLCLDGTGYGSDKKIWGGEILNSGYSRFERLASLEEIPLIGSDAAIKDPRRIVFGIGEKVGKHGEKLYMNLKLSKTEMEIFRKTVSIAPVTTSLGRVLDALSCTLGICMKQTYDGEPAMKLEKYLLAGEGKEILEFNVETSSVDGRKILKTVSLFEQLSENLKHDISDRKKAVLAYSFVHALTKAFAEIGVDCAKRKGIEHVGITGGVSYNEVITRIAEDTVKRSGKKFLIHNNIPNGDNGIAVGQNAIAGHIVSD